MALSYIGASSSPGATSANVVITPHGSAAAGDLALVGWITYDGHTVSDDLGWALAGTHQYSTRCETAVYAKILEAGDLTELTFTFVDSEYQRAGMIIVRGADPTTPVAAVYGTGGGESTSVVASTVTPTIASSMIVLFSGTRDNNTQSGWAMAVSDPGMSEAFDVNYNGAGDVGIGCGYGIRPETTATGNVTVTQSGADYFAAISLVINPAVAASGWTGKLNGVTNPGKINGLAVANIAKVNGVA